MKNQVNLRSQDKLEFKNKNLFRCEIDTAFFSELELSPAPWKAVFAPNSSEEKTFSRVASIDLQRKMISFLKNLSNIYPQDLKKEFINLHSELIKFENHPYEKRSFLYLDIWYLVFLTR